MGSIRPDSRVVTEKGVAFLQAVMPQFGNCRDSLLLRTGKCTFQSSLYTFQCHFMGSSASL